MKQKTWFTVGGAVSVVVAVVAIAAIRSLAFTGPTGGGGVGSGAISADASGRVGIGTAVPTGKLDILGNSATNAFTAPSDQADLRVLSSQNRSWDGGIIEIGGSAGATGYIKTEAYNNNAGAMTFGTRRNPADVTMQPTMTLDSGGNVAIGTVNPDVNYKLTTTGGGVKAENSSASQPAGYFGNAGGGPAVLVGPGGLTLGGVNQTTWPAGGLTGGGTVNYLSKFTGAAAIGNSQIFDNGTNVGIGSSADNPVPAAPLHITGGTAMGPSITAPSAELRLARSGTGGTKYSAQADFKIGTYLANVNSGTQLDIALGNGATNVPDTTVMTFLGSGNVGIGTAAPAAKLDIMGGASTNYLRFSAAGNGNFGSVVTDGANSPTLTLQNPSSFSLFTLNPDTGMTFTTSNAKVGIGTAAPGAPLHIAGVNVLDTPQGAIMMSRYYVSPANLRASALYDRYNSAAANEQLVFGVSGDGGPSLTLPTDAANAKMVIQANGNVGINNTNPGTRLDVIDDSINAGIRVRHSNLTQGISIGYNTIAANGSNPSQDINISPKGAGNVIFNTGNVGIGTSAPSAMLTVGGTASGQIDIAHQGGAYTSAYPYQRFFYGGTEFMRTYMDGAWGYVMDTTSNPATGNIVLNPKGSVLIGTGGAGKIVTGTVDPPYTINGEKYATYLPGMTGQKEETTGVINLAKASNGTWQTKIDFNTLKKGSDLWLFSQTTNLKKQIGSMSVLLTAAFDGNVWYHIDPAAMTLTIMGKPVGDTRDLSVSYRLTASRFDSALWPNTRTDEAPGLIVNN